MRGGETSSRHTASGSESGKRTPESVEDLLAMGYSQEQIDDWDAEGLDPLEEYKNASPVGDFDAEYHFRAHEENGMEDYSDEESEHAQENKDQPSVKEKRINSIDSLLDMGYSRDQIDDWISEGLDPLDEYRNYSPAGGGDDEYHFRAHEQNGMEQNGDDSDEPEQNDTKNDAKNTPEQNNTKHTPEASSEDDSSKDFLSNRFGKEVLRVALVNQDADLESIARYRGENKLGEALNEHKGIRKVLDHIWKGGFMRSYYRQKYIQQAREEIKQTGSLMTEYDEKERRQYNGAVCDLFIDEVANIDTEHGDKRESLKNTNPELLKDISDLVKRYARGDIDNTEAANREFAELLKNAKQEGFDDKNFFISNIDSVVIEARQRYEDMITIAQATCSRIDHEEALNSVMNGFDLVYGNNQMERRTPSYNRVDRVVEKLKSTKVGCMVPTGTLALAAGAAASITEFMGKRAIGAAFVGAFGVSGAISAGLQASTTFEQERARAFYDERYSREVDPNDKEREKMMKTVYEHHNAYDEAMNLDKLRKEAAKIIEDGGDVSAKAQEILQAVARCTTYLRMDKEGNSLLKYSSEMNAPEEQLMLLQQITRSKTWLSDENGGNIENLEDQLENASDLMQNVRDEIEKDLGDVDKLARRQKVAKIMRKSGKSLLVGAAFGFATQEIGALMNPDVQGIFEKDDGYATSLTAGRKLANWIRGDTTARHDDLLAHINITGENSSNLVNGQNSNMEFVKANDGTYTLFRDGKEVAKGIDWNAQTGKLTPESLKLLHAQGVDVSRTQDLDFHYVTQVEGTKMDQISLSDYYKQFGDEATKVRRSFWYDNDTSVFDHNELACHDYVDPVTGARGFITRMTDSGSWHGDSAARFSELAKNGEIRLFISPTWDTQSEPFEVVGKLVGDNQLAFVPEEGSICAQMFTENGFIGRLGEVAQVLGTGDNGETLIAPLATATGSDFEGLIDTIVPTIEDVPTDGTVPEYLFSITDPELPWRMPMIFPFMSDGAMKNSRRAEYVKHPRVRERLSSLYYSYNNPTEERPELGPDGRSVVKGEISPRITERKQLHLGQEVSDYRERMRKAGESEYMDFIDKQIERSRELSNMDDSVKMVIMLPVWAHEDSDKVYDAMSLYAQQKGVDLSSFMILIDVNDGLKPTDEHITDDEANNAGFLTDEERAFYGTRRPTKRELVERRMQRTFAEVDRARADFPGLKIATVSHAGRKGGVVDASRVMADSVMLAIDKAVKEGHMSADNDILMVRNDVDVKHIDSHYIEGYQEAARKNPKTPIFTGTTWFNTNHQRRVPGLGAVTTIERMSNLFGALDGRIHTAGGNFGYRASHFAAINGYGFAANGDLLVSGAGADDLRAGQRLADAFDASYWERMYNSGNPADGDLMDPQTRMLVRVGKANADTDNLRYLKFYADAGGGVTNDAYRPDGGRPESVLAGGYDSDASRGSWTEWKDFHEDIWDESDGERNKYGFYSNRQLFNATVEQVEEEFTDYISCNPSKTGRESCMRIINWYLMSSNNGLYTVTEEEDTTRRYGDGKRYAFHFTEAGREQLRKAMVRRVVGDGTGNQDMNGHQRAIRSGDWVRRASDTANNAVY